MNAARQAAQRILDREARHSHHTPRGRKPKPQQTVLVYEDVGASLPPSILPYPIGGTW